MPFVQIHLRSGRSEVWLQKLSRTIHQSMIEEINVPEDDYFQVIRQYEKSEFFYDPFYLQVERTDELIYIHFTLKQSRTTEQKKSTLPLNREPDSFRAWCKKRRCVYHAGRKSG